MLLLLMMMMMMNVSLSLIDVCHGSTVERQVAAAVGEVVVSLTDLEPVRFYHIWVSSMSTANSQSTAVHLTVKTGPGSLSAAIITVIVIASCMIIVLFVAGAAFIFRYILTCTLQYNTVQYVGSLVPSLQRNRNGWALQC